MENEQEFDVVVIGSGPGGEGAAMQAAKGGLKVGVVERFPLVGGSCTHTGTIPSKTLRQAAYRLTLFQREPLLSKALDPMGLKFSDMLNRARDVTASQVKLRTSHYQRNDVEVIHGDAKIRDPHTIFVDRGLGAGVNLKAKHIVLATGSRPVHPDNVDMSHPRIFDSDSILHLEHRPRIVTIYGAGVVGCEYTSIFRTLGKKVNLINNRDQLLSFLDNEIIDALSYHLRDQGVLIRNNEQLDSVEPYDDAVVLNLKSGKRIKSDIVLFAIGRKGNSDYLGLEDLGVKVNPRGYVIVNQNGQTSVPNIYAVGDLIGFPSLASSAYDQGRFAARHIVSPSNETYPVENIPVGIYTSPEISCIGRTEAQLTAERVPFEVGHASFKQLARAQITGQTVGMLKILFHAETLEILGIHCFGHNAAEIIHIGQAIMAQAKGANSLKYFTNTTFNYPTMAEAYRVAALNGLNRLC